MLKPDWLVVLSGNKKMEIFGFKKWNKGKIVLTILVAVVLILGLKNVTSAEPPPGFGGFDKTSTQLHDSIISGATPDMSAGTTSMVVGTLLDILVSITAGLLTFVAYLMIFALNFGNQVITLDIVKIGSGVVLGLANMGFVLAIIVMAFATIFRISSYAMKQTLWKLIVAAILVNFSLVIAGGIISVSNSFTDYFVTQSATYGNLADGLAGVVNPGNVLAVSNTEDPSLWSTITSPFSYFLKFIASLVFVLILSFIILLTFFALFIMFLIRAIYLGILLILMPIIWLLWIFPATKQHWQKWWKEFIRWNFFAPVVLFFIYIVIATGKAMNDKVAAIANANLTGTKFSEAIAQVGFMNQGFLAYAAQGIIATGLLVGGLFAANSMGIAFATTAYGWAQGAGRWMGRESLEHTGGRLFGSRLFKGGINKKGEETKGLVERLSASRIPGVRFVGRGLNKLGAKTEQVVQGEYAKSAKGLSPDRLNYEIQNSRGVRRAVLMAEAAKRKDTDFEKLEPMLNDPDKMSRIAKDFNNAGLNFKDVEKAIGRSLKMIMAKDTAELEQATNEYVQSQAPKDWARGQWNDFFKETTNPKMLKFQKQLARSIAEQDPGIYAKIAPNVKSGKNFRNFSDIMKKEATLLSMSSNPDEKERGERALSNLQKTLNRRAEFGEEAWTPGPGGATTP